MEFLHQREIEAVGNRPGAHMASQRCRARDAIARHRGLVIGPGDLVRDADGEGRKIVEKKGVEVVVGVDHQHVGRGIVQAVCDFRKELGRPAIRPLLGHQRGKIRGVRDAEGGDDLGHVPPLAHRAAG